MSKVLTLPPSDHKTCFFLSGSFLKHLPADVRAYLVHDKTTDPLSLALKADMSYQSEVSSASAVSSVSSVPEECPFLASMHLLPPAPVLCPL